ncbi:MAG TPA: adenylate/guanylate cyclase domain-containing protein [Vicinamibacterales bacterium]|nr:adenylate/guanylate cyclase domain-containing protein [Vicinamibacterales bacterium]
MFTLIYQEDGVWRRHALANGETSVGRTPDNDLVLRHPSVSRKHARLQVDASGCRVQDVGSRLHTYVNGEKVYSAPLKDGDRLTLGQFTLRVEESQDNVVVTPGDRLSAEFEGTILRPARPLSGIFPAAAATSEEERTQIQHQQLLSMLAEVSGMLTRTHDLGAILDRVVSLTFELVPADRVFLLLTDEHSGELVPRIARTRSGTRPTAASISGTVTRRVMTEKTAMLATDTALDKRLESSQSLVAQRVRSFMCAPLWTEGDVLGVMYVDTPTSRSFKPSDLDVFTMVANYAAVAIEQARLSARLLEETRRLERLQRYHSPAVAERILARSVSSETAPDAQEREISVLFADLVGFTTLSETLPPTEIARILTTFFTSMTDVIFEQEGTLDKYIGDAVLAVWGAPLDQPDHAARAVKAALTMRERLRDVNDKHLHQLLRMRLAINSGRALVGDIGAPRRREFTVLGDVVNTAARLQAQVCEPDQILMTEATYSLAGRPIAARPRGSVQVRGRAGKINVYEI